VGLGRKGAGEAAALEQAANPGGADAEQVGDLLPGAAAFVAGADDAFAQVLGVSKHVADTSFLSPIILRPLHAVAKRSSRKPQAKAVGRVSR